MVVDASPQDKSCEAEVKDLQMNTIETLRMEIEKEKERSENFLNRLKYLQADFENYKKRVEKEVEETTNYANRRLINELLIVLDDLECAVEAGKQGISKAFLEGVEMTLKKLYNTLKKEGVSKIETVGKPFDPNKHEAVLRVNIDGKDGVILEEVRKGFMLKDMVIRPSLVKVAVHTLQKGEKNE